LRLRMRINMLHRTLKWQPNMWQPPIG